MKKNILFIAILFTVITGGICQGQPDSLNPQKVKNYIYYFETGFGFNTRGMNFDMSATAGSANGLGGSLNFMAGYVKVKYVPDDYISLFRWFKPTNDFIAITPAMTMKFTNSEQTFRFGVEAGPSFMNWNTVRIELNPNYPDLFEYKYNKFETRKTTTGCYLALKADIPATKFLGFSFTLFGIINNIEQLIGFDITITLGKVKSKTD